MELLIRYCAETVVSTGNKKTVVSVGGHLCA